MLLGGVRRWVFLPTLVCCIVCLVTYQGGDALSIALNTVAIIFLVEVDNVAYAVVSVAHLIALVED